MRQIHAFRIRQRKGPMRMDVCVASFQDGLNVLHNFFQCLFSLKAQAERDLQYYVGEASNCMSPSMSGSDANRANRNSVQ
jgi:hypothetical protein